MISWHNSITARYAVISVIAAVGATLLVGGAYDRYSTGLVDTLTGERLDRRLAAISSRLTVFLEVRTNTLDTLVNYPGIVALTQRPVGSAEEPGLRAVIELEADHPDLYGVLLFDTGGTLVSAIPSQAASGPPYWGEHDERIEMAPRRIGNPHAVNVLGPYPPTDGRPGSMLMVRGIPGPRPDSPPAGWVALHVRLASLTEIMGPNDNDLIQSVLITPGGQAYSNVGVGTALPQDIVRGPAILPGWQPALVVADDRFVEPLKKVRSELVLVTCGVTISLIVLFFLLSRRLATRVSALVDGSQKISAGTLTWRIALDGRDEIAAVALAFNRMSERLQDIIRSAVEGEKMAALGRFATGLAHELRNPLSTVKTTVQALLVSETTGERRDLLSNIDDEIDRLDETLNDFLGYARPRQPQTINLAIWSLLERLAAMSNSLLHENKVTLVMLGEPDVVVVADPGHVKQIAMNLLLNAVQAMPEGGVLTIRAHRAEGMGMIEISDTGVGMPPEILSRVAEPFFTTRRDGTGLGLSISRQLTELNGGTLELSSEVGHGTSVMVRLPLAETGER